MGRVALGCHQWTQWTFAGKAEGSHYPGTAGSLPLVFSALRHWALGWGKGTAAPSRSFPSRIELQSLPPRPVTAFPPNEPCPALLPPIPNLSSLPSSLFSLCCALQNHPSSRLPALSSQVLLLFPARHRNSHITSQAQLCFCPALPPPLPGHSLRPLYCRAVSLIPTCLPRK